MVRRAVPTIDFYLLLVRVFVGRDGSNLRVWLDLEVWLDWGVLERACCEIPAVAGWRGNLVRLL